MSKGPKINKEPIPSQIINDVPPEISFLYDMLSDEIRRHSVSIEDKINDTGIRCPIKNKINGVLPPELMADCISHQFVLDNALFELGIITSYAGMMGELISKYQNLLLIKNGRNELFQDVSELHKKIIPALKKCVFCYKDRFPDSYQYLPPKKWSGVLSSDTKPTYVQ